MSSYLELDKYSNEDLLDIFKINKNDSSSYDFIKNKCVNYISDIQQNKSVSLMEKDNIINFLRDAMNKLLKNSNLIRNDDLEEIKYQDTREIIKKDLNPMNRHKILKSLNINTMFRKNYYDTKSEDFTIDLNDNISRVTSIALETAEIPNVIYRFSTKNRTNEFTIELFDLSDNVGTNAKTSNNVTKINETKIVVKIKDGNYTAQELVDYLNRYILGLSGQEIRRVGAMYDKITGKILFIRDKSNEGRGGMPVTSLEGDPIEKLFNIDWRLSDEPNRPIQMNMGWILGYRKQYYNYEEDYNHKNTANPTLEGECYSPEAIFDSKSSKYIFLSVDDFNNNHTQSIISPFQESVFNSNMILAKLVNNGDNYNFVNQELDKKYIRKYFGPVTINKLRITLYDELGRIIDFNNTDYSISLRIEQIYEHAK